jgi:hypothetical protein
VREADLQSFGILDTILLELDDEHAWIRMLSRTMPHEYQDYQRPGRLRRKDGIRFPPTICGVQIAEQTSCSCTLGLARFSQPTVRSFVGRGSFFDHAVG